jgi:plasmid maintenance system antidote protein VapI
MIEVGTPMNTGRAFLAMAEEIMLMSCVRQYELAERVGVTPKHMNQIFGGKVRLTMDMADRMADALNVRIAIGLDPRGVRR